MHLMEEETNTRALVKHQHLWDNDSSLVAPSYEKLNCFLHVSSSMPFPFPLIFPLPSPFTGRTVFFIDGSRVVGRSKMIGNGWSVSMSAGLDVGVDLGLELGASEGIVLFEMNGAEN